MNRAERRKQISVKLRAEKIARREFEAGIIHVNIADHPATSKIQDGDVITVAGYEKNGKLVRFIAHRCKTD